jgi:hypothetical protein
MEVKEAFNKFSTVLLEDEIKSWRENMAWKTNVNGNCSLLLYLWLMLLSAIKSCPRGCVSNFRIIEISRLITDTLRYDMVSRRVVEHPNRHTFLPPRIEYRET